MKRLGVKSKKVYNWVGDVIPNWGCRIDGIDRSTELRGPVIIGHPWFIFVGRFHTNIQFLQKINVNLVNGTGI